jgi:hypothetical protein
MRAVRLRDVERGSGPAADNGAAGREGLRHVRFLVLLGQDSVMEYRIEWPAPMDEADWTMQEIKGWLDVTVTWDGGSQVVEVYDPVRLEQTAALELDQSGYFTARCLLVVPSVTPENIESAISALADKGFFDRTR